MRKKHKQTMVAKSVLLVSGYGLGIYVFGRVVEHILKRTRRRATCKNKVTFMNVVMGSNNNRHSTISLLQQKPITDVYNNVPQFCLCCM